MDVAGIASLLGVPAAIVVAILLALKERSDLRWIERLLAIDESKISSRRVRFWLNELRVEVLMDARKKRAFAESATMRWSGFAVAFVSLALVEALDVLGTKGKAWETIRLSLFLLVALGLLTAIASMVVAVIALGREKSKYEAIRSQVLREQARTKQEPGSEKAGTTPPAE